MEGNVRSTETVPFPGMNRAERSGRLDSCFSSSPGTRSSLQFAEHFLAFGLVIHHLPLC